MKKYVLAQPYSEWCFTNVSVHYDYDDEEELQCMGDLEINYSYSLKDARKFDTEELARAYILVLQDMFPLESVDLEVKEIEE